MNFVNEAQKFCCEVVFNLTTYKLCSSKTEATTAQLVQQTAENTLARLIKECIISYVPYGSSQSWFGSTVRFLFLGNNPPFHIARHTLASEIYQKIDELKTDKEKETEELLSPEVKTLISLVLSDLAFAGILYGAAMASDALEMPAISKHFRSSSPTLASTCLSVMLVSLFYFANDQELSDH